LPPSSFTCSLVCLPAPVSTHFPSRRSSDLKPLLARRGRQGLVLGEARLENPPLVLRPCLEGRPARVRCHREEFPEDLDRGTRQGDRKSTRLNSSHVKISYAVFCLKKKKQKD